MTPWSRRKKDAAPRGVFRHRSSTRTVAIWAIRYVCGCGHVHEERVGTVKTEAIRAHHERRARAGREPGWCPATERAAIRAQAARAITMADYAEDYTAWARREHRSFKNTRSEVARLAGHFGARPLASITSADVEGFLGMLRDGERAVSGATQNRYRDRISGMFTRAIRLGLVVQNPARGIRKVRESTGRVVYLTAETERAIHDQLPPALRPLVTVAVNTGLRWSEQAALRWVDVDLLVGVVTVRRAKNGHSRQVPINSTVARVLVELGAARPPHSDPRESVFAGVAYRTVSRAFGAAVSRAHAALRDAGQDPSRLEGFTWHGLRHTFASRLAMAGVDPRTIQELGGWRTLALVMRYAHLSPTHLRAAVERLVVDSPGSGGAVALRQDFDAPTHVEREPRVADA